MSIITKEEMKYWILQARILNILREHNEYLSSIKDMKKAFIPQNSELVCIDERCRGKLPIAGSGILLGLEKAAQIAEEAGIKTVTSHEGCGAAKLWAQLNNKCGNPDNHSKDFSQELASRLRVPYRHIRHEELQPSTERHVATAIYVVGTELFYPTEVKGLPLGFRTSRRYSAASDVAEEIKVAASIAFGSHGFGELFTPETPLYIIAVGDPKKPGYSLESLEHEAKYVISSDRTLRNAYNEKKLLVRGFSAPL